VVHLCLNGNKLVFSFFLPSYVPVGLNATHDLNLRQEGALRTQYGTVGIYLNSRLFKLRFSAIFYFVTQGLQRKNTDFFFNIGLFTLRDKLRVSK